MTDAAPPRRGRSVERGESQPLLLEHVSTSVGESSKTRRPSAEHLSLLDNRRNSILALEYKKLHQRPFVQRWLSNKFTVANPSSADLSHDDSSVHSIDSEWPMFHSRALILSQFRPEKLIGNWYELADWRASVRDTTGLKGAVRAFYQNQNSLIERYQEIDNFLDYGKIHLNMLGTYTKKTSSIPEEPQEPELRRVKSRFNDLPGNLMESGRFLGYDSDRALHEVLVAILVNFFINAVLLAGKIAISIMTSSLSVVASLVDSILDFLSTFIIYVANRLSNTKNWRTQLAYPIGRTKLEPLGVLIFSVIIIISFFQVGLEACKRLMAHEDPDVVKIGWDAVGIMVATILAKLACWWWCSRSKSSSVQALAQDAMTDIVFNLVSLVMPTLGLILHVWWLDPVGALLLSLYVVVSWSITAFERIDNLTGSVASLLDYKVVLYLAYRFAEPIKQITALKVYHVGDLVNVEIDVVFNTVDFDLSFRDAHDLAEALQYAIETLPMVERAFVHIDYMEGNFKGHLT